MFPLQLRRSLQSCTTDLDGGVGAGGADEPHERRQQQVQVVLHSGAQGLVEAKGIRRDHTVNKMLEDVLNICRIIYTNRSPPIDFRAT